jgi:hypothetical protein
MRHPEFISGSGAFQDQILKQVQDDTGWLKIRNFNKNSV